MERDAAELISLVTNSNLRFDEEGGRVDMCQAIEEMRQESIEQAIDLGRKQGIENTRLESVRSLMETMRLTAQQAMDALMIPADEQSRYIAML